MIFPSFVVSTVHKSNLLFALLNRHVPIAHPPFKFFFFLVILIVLFLLSRHSTHSSDEAGFNDPSLLENLQSNHVSSASASFLPSAGLLGRRKI